MAVTGQRDSQGAPTDEVILAFLSDLGDLSRRHGLAIGDGATLYVMEQDDFTRAYRLSGDSELTFA